MRKIKFILLAAMVLIIIIAIAKDSILDTPSQALCRYKKMYSETKPSKIVYRMFYWSILPLGTLTFVTEQTNDEFASSVEANPVGGILGGRIEASAKLESRAHKQNRLPYVYNEVTLYKNKLKKKTILYDQEKLIVTRGERKIQLASTTFDPIGAFSYLLDQRLYRGCVYNIPLLAEDDIYTMEAKGIEENQGLVKVEITIKRANGTSSHGAHFYVWVIADKYNVPILFKSWTPVGYASVVLESINQ